MFEFFSTLLPAHWLIAAFVLAILEALFPGAVFIWFSIAAALVSALSYVFGLGWQTQIVLFGLTALGSVAAWRVWRRAKPAQSPLPQLNRRAQQYEGQLCEVVDAIVNGSGKVRVGDTVWTVRGADAPVGARVRVVGADGTVLEVVLAAQSAP